MIDLPNIEGGGMTRRNFLQMPLAVCAAVTALSVKDGLNNSPQTMANGY